MEDKHATTRSEATTARSTTRKILLLAIPTFGQLVAEPAFVLADTAIVGHVSESALAGLAVGSTLVLTAVGLCVFLAYATTSRVAMLFGSGRAKDGISMGVDNLWLSLAIGVALAVSLFAGAEPLCSLLGATGTDLQQAVIYTRAVVLGIPGMLLVYAANGLYRGLQRIRITLVVAVSGALLNTVLDVAFVIGLGWGIGGSGFATFLAQWFMGVCLVVPVVVWARRSGVGLRPSPKRIASVGMDGFPLFVRTLALRAGIVATVVAAASLGTEALAGYQVVNAAWSFMLNVLDSVAIAGQTLVGAQLGTGSLREARRVANVTMRSGLAMGFVVGAAFVALGMVAPQLFSECVEVQQLATIGMVVTGIALPMQGWMWAVDGILIGAADFKYLAWTCALVTLIYVGLLTVLVGAVSPMVEDVRMSYGLLWAAFDFGLMGGRAITNGMRIRGDAWMKVARETAGATDRT